MSDPNWEPAPVLAGDPHDDDPSVIDDLVTSNPIPPDPAASRESVVNHLDQRPKRNTRILSGYQVLDANARGVQFLILPADHNRKSLTVSVGGVGTNDSALIADEAAKFAYNGQSGQSARIYTGKSVQGIDSHTGPLWIAIPLDNVSPVVVSWVSVTE